MSGASCSRTSSSTSRNSTRFRGGGSRPILAGRTSGTTSSGRCRTCPRRWVGSGSSSRATYANCPGTTNTSGRSTSRREGLGASRTTGHRQITHRDLPGRLDLDPPGSEQRCACRCLGGSAVSHRLTEHEKDDIHAEEQYRSDQGNGVWARDRLRSLPGHGADLRRRGRVVGSDRRARAGVDGRLDLG